MKLHIIRKFRKITTQLCSKYKMMFNFKLFGMLQTRLVISEVS